MLFGWEKIDDDKHFFIKKATNRATGGRGVIHGPMQLAAQRALPTEVARPRPAIVVVVIVAAEAAGHIRGLIKISFINC